MTRLMLLKHWCTLNNNNNNNNTFYFQDTLLKNSTIKQQNSTINSKLKSVTRPIKCQIRGSKRMGEIRWDRPSETGMF